MRPVGSKSGRIPEGGYPEVDDEFGGFLAGFVEGEASFVIRKQPRGSNHGCGMSLSVRDDDATLVRELAESTSLGTVCAVASRGSTKPQVRWNVVAKSDCLRLIELLDLYPLRGRKSREFAIWRAAVNWWVDGDPTSTQRNRDWEPMAYLKQTIHEVRRYKWPTFIDLYDGTSGLEADWGSFLAGFATAEGTFGINKNGSNRLLPRFQIAVRLDDAELLRALRNRTALGRVYASYRVYGGRNPAAIWSVCSRPELLELRAILDRFPVRGRKAREYKVWRKAVTIYAGSGAQAKAHRRLAPLRDALRRERAYRPAPYA